MCKCRSHGTFPLFGLQSSHLNICYYHQDPHQRPLRLGSRPRFCSDRRALLLIGAWHLPRRPGVGRALKRHPFSGLVDSAGMLTLEPFSKDQGRSAVHPAKGIPPISFLAPSGFTHPLTRTHVRLLGPCFKTGRMGCPQAGAGSTQGCYRRSTSFSSFPRGTCLLSVSRRYLALDGIYRPIGAAFPNNSTRRQRLVVRQGPGTTGLSPSLAPPSRGLGPSPPLRTLLQTTIRTARPPDFQAGLIPVRSPLLRESFIVSRRHIGVFIKGLPHSSRRTTQYEETNLRPDAMCPDKGCMVGGDAMRDAQAGVPSAGWLWAQLAFKKLDGSRDSAIHTKYRILLRSSSMREPRYPLPRDVCDSKEATTNMHTANGTKLDASFSFFAFLGTYRAGVHVHGSFCFAGFDNDPSAGSRTETLLRLLLPLNDKVQWNSRDLAGGEPPTSP
ncbi:hypothetical protein L2E82_09223 [Cichorium intybus]|uniref:Uncharacterized protein n=1 Tax=Cichorium intybus TaxID=13427 RepID=A0ACB9G9U4_CICIN|nr:hypothetical protein L2E82_09223 [Cichorium intybus]